MANDGHVVAGRPAQRTTVTLLLLHVADNSSFWDGAEREHVADVQRGILAGVDELASVHALVGDEGLGVKLVPVRVAERHLCERCSTARVVDDVLDDTTDVSMALGVVVGPELRGSLVEANVRSEDRAAALPLVANDTTL